MSLDLADRIRAAGDGRKVKTKQAAQGSQQGDLPGGDPPTLLFERLDWTLYVSLSTLPQRAGVSAGELPRLVAKELTDNALDSADNAGVPGGVTLTLVDGNLTVADLGTGIPGATPAQLASIFSIAQAMRSSKLLRRATRGAVGNGLRVVVGWIAATGGRLIIETGTVRVELAPDDLDGSSRIVSSETIEPIKGLALTVVAGKTWFTEHDLSWAEISIQLAKGSSEAAFTGRASAHWFDLDNFRIVLRSAVGNPSIRQFLDQFDGCRGSRAQSRIAAQFLRRSAATLNAEEAAALLLRARAETKPPKPSVLRPLGKDALITGGYAKAEGSFTTGLNAPTAQIPFIVEAWADAFSPHEQDRPAGVALFMNRTRAVTHATFNLYPGELYIDLSGTGFDVTVPKGPRYGILINITAPTFLLTSDGKTPDCRVFRTALIDAVAKAAKQAGRDVADAMSAEERYAATQRKRQQREEEQNERFAEREEQQKRLAEIAQEKARRQARPSIRSVVIELLPWALGIEAESGHYFSSRRLVYRMREKVKERTGKELRQGTFDQLVTEIEAEQGSVLHPLLIREARGNFSIPHGIKRGAYPLGTLSVRGFVRPPWCFNKILVIEKEDLRFMLEQAEWDRRNDAVLVSSIGFNSRACRDFIDDNAATSEPLTVFSVHDADFAGTVIHHTLQNATLARGARKIEVIDLGLQPWEGYELGLSVETVDAKYTEDHERRRRPVGDYIRDRTDRPPPIRRSEDDEPKHYDNWEEWLQDWRFELNAFTSAGLIEWLDRKMAEQGAGKLVPPDDILHDQFRDRVRYRVHNAVSTELDRRFEEQLFTIDYNAAEATKHIHEEILKVTAGLRKQLTDTEAPFDRQAEEAKAQAEAVNQDEIVHAVITRMLPDAEQLRADIFDGFRETPEVPWNDVLDEIADRAEAGDIDEVEPAEDAP